MIWMVSSYSCVLYFHFHFPHRVDASSSRPDYSPPLSCPLLSIRFTISKLTQHSRWSTTSNRMLPYSLRSLPRSPLSLLRCPSHPLHHLLSLPLLPTFRTSASTSSGS